MADDLVGELQKAKEEIATQAAHIQQLETRAREQEDRNRRYAEQHEDNRALIREIQKDRLLGTTRIAVVTAVATVSLAVFGYFIRSREGSPRIPYRIVVQPSAGSKTSPQASPPDLDAAADIFDRIFVPKIDKVYHLRAQVLTGNMDAAPALAAMFHENALVDNTVVDQKNGHVLASETIPLYRWLSKTKLIGQSKVYSDVTIEVDPEVKFSLVHTSHGARYEVELFQRFSASGLVQYVDCGEQTLAWNGKEGDEPKIIRQTHKPVAECRQTKRKLVRSLKMHRGLLGRVLSRTAS